MTEIYVGVDLATKPKRTGVCVIEWPARGRPNARFIEDDAGRTDAKLVELFLTADAIAIDVPFGWPAAFTAALVAWGDRQTWDGPRYEDSDVSSHLRYRETDLNSAALSKEAVMKRRATDPCFAGLRLPQSGISVSTNWLGATALRGAGLLDLAKRSGVRFDRGADSPSQTSIVEAYPAAALAAWGLTWAGLGPDWPEVALVADLEDHIEFDNPGGLRNRDNFDAVICALVARAWRTGQVVPAAEIAPNHRADEGWIAYPNGRFEELFSRPAAQ